MPSSESKETSFINKHGKCSVVSMLLLERQVLIISVPFVDYFSHHVHHDPASLDHAVLWWPGSVLPTLCDASSDGMNRKYIHLQILQLLALICALGVCHENQREEVDTKEIVCIYRSSFFSSIIVSSQCRVPLNLYQLPFS